MSDQRTYIARCKRCGSLGKPCDIKTAVAECETPLAQYPTHKTYYTPIKYN